MPLSIVKNINARWSETSAQIIQLDRTSVPTIGELRDVIIQLSHDSQVHQCINIVVVDIPEAYSLLLKRDWSSKLDGYFGTDWSHMRLSYKGKCHQIWVETERYMKHNFTPLNSENELLAFAKLMFGNCLLEKTLECYPARPSPTSLDTQLGLLPCPTDGNETCTFYFSDSSSRVMSRLVGSGATLDMKIYTLKIFNS